MPRQFEELTVFENVLVAAQQGAPAATEESYDLAAVLTGVGLRADANRPASPAPGSCGASAWNWLGPLATQPRLHLLDLRSPGTDDPRGRPAGRRSSGQVGPTSDAAKSGSACGAIVEVLDRLICDPWRAGGSSATAPPTAVLASPAVKEVFLGTEATAESLTEDGHWSKPGQADNGPARGSAT